MQGRRELILLIIAMARGWCELRSVRAWEGPAGRVTPPLNMPGPSSWEDLLPVKGCLAGPATLVALCPPGATCLAPLAILYKDISSPCIGAVCPIFFASHSQLGHLVKTLACFFPNLLH